MTLLNLLGIVVAGVAAMLLGWLWFDRVFGRTYKRLLGRDPASPGDPSPLYVVGPSLSMLIAVVAMSFLMQWLAISTLGSAVAFGLLVGLGLLGTTAVNMGINPNIPRPLPYGFLSASYFAVASVVISVILFSIGR